MRLINLRSVTTRVTVSDVHSVVRMNTPRIHTYLGGADQVNGAVRGCGVLVSG